MTTSFQLAISLSPVTFQRHMSQDNSTSQATRHTVIATEGSL
jgi:hypothetical protein